MGAKGSKASSSSSAALSTTITDGDSGDTARQGNGAVGNGSGASLGVKPDASLSSDTSTPEENAAKRKAYAHLESPYAKRQRPVSAKVGSDSSGPNSGAAASSNAHTNLIERIYNEDFDTIDHVQALRLPPIVAQQLKSAVRDEAERRCAEVEKQMARCLQDKMWTSWKCQKERDKYYHCVQETEQCHLRPDPTNPSWVDMLTSFRWKYNLGVFHGEIIGRNNIMKEIWREHYPDRELPHPMIRVFAKRDVPVMDIVELQGKIIITEEALRAARDAQERRRASRRKKRRSGAAKSDTAVTEDANGTRDDALSLSSPPSSSYSSSDDGSSRSSSSTGEEGDATGSDRATAETSEAADLEMRRQHPHNSREWRGAADSTSASASSPRGGLFTRCPSATSPHAVVEVPLGHLEQDRLNDKRCILCIDTLRVHGSRSTFKNPWLVLRECTPARMRRLRRQMERTQVHCCGTQARDAPATSERRGDGAAVAKPADDTASSSSSEPTLLFSEWLRQHPEALSLDSLFLDDFDTGVGDDVSGCGATAAGPTCAAPKSASLESLTNSAGGHKRARAEERVGGTALDCQSPAPQSPSGASIVPSATRVTAYKNYELIGVVRDAVLFNSKPSRVFP